MSRHACRRELTKSVTVLDEQPPVVVILVAESRTSQPVIGAQVEAAACVVDGPAEKEVTQSEADFFSHCSSLGSEEYVGSPSEPMLRAYE